MPRRRKFDTNHDRVLPVSLSEVQLTVSNSINGDSVDEDAIGRALQGYQLLLQGGLRDSSYTTTRTLHEHGGYHRNLMRSVAHLFGIRESEREVPDIVRGNFSDEDIASTDDSQLEANMRKEKRSRTAANVIVNASSSAEKMMSDGKRARDSIENLQANTTEGNKKRKPQVSSVSLSYDLVHLDSEDERLPQNRPDEVEPAVVHDKTNEQRNQSSTFNRYKHAKRRQTETHEPRSPTVTKPNEEDGALVQSQEVSNIHCADIVHLNMKPLTSSKGIPFQEEKAMLAPNSEVVQETRESKGQSTVRSLLSTAKETTQKEPDVTSSCNTGSVPPTSRDEGAMAGDNVLMVDLNGSVRDVNDIGASGTKASEIRGQIPHRERNIRKDRANRQSTNTGSRTNHEEDESGKRKSHVQPILSKNNCSETPMTVRSKISDAEVNRAPSKLGSSIIEEVAWKEGMPSPTESISSSHNIKADDVYNIAETIVRGSRFKTFFNQEAIQILLSNVLPGTWMSNHKMLAKTDFLQPQESNTYFMLLQFNIASGVSSQNQDVWQLLLIKNIKDHCEVLREKRKLGEIRDKPSLFVFESSHTDVKDEIFLCARNLLRGVLQRELRRSNRSRILKKDDLNRMKDLVRKMCCDVVHVRMPASNTSSLGAAYFLANLQYLSSEERLQSVLQLEKAIQPSKTKERTFGRAKNKLYMLGHVYEVDATGVYSDNYVEPLMVLT